jgi:hypothetical protein
MSYREPAPVEALPEPQKRSFRLPRALRLSDGAVRFWLIVGASVLGNGVSHLCIAFKAGGSLAAPVALLVIGAVLLVVTIVWAILSDP